MIVKYSPEFLAILKRKNVRIRKSFKKRIIIFSRNPNDPELNNHLLYEPYQNYRSIDITSDYRAHYEEVTFENEKIAYFIALGTHEQLYGTN